MINNALLSWLRKLDLKELIIIRQFLSVLRTIIFCTACFGITQYLQATIISEISATTGIYNGTELTPVFNATPAGATYTYSVSGGTTSTTATEVGSYTINWEGTGNYTGSGTTTWTIINNLFNVSSAATTPMAFIVPDGVASITVDAWGAGASGGSNSGGLKGTPGAGGGYAGATFAVTPGEVLYYVVGSGGGAHSSSQVAAAGLPGGSSDGSVDQGAGGGYTGLFTSTTLTQANALIIAGAGAGGGRVSSGVFNSGNGTQGDNPYGGYAAAAGTALKALSRSGGGYVGGNYGTGGSSYVSSAGVDPVLITNAQGSTVTFNQLVNAANTSNPNYIAPAGVGGSGGGLAGKAGQLVITMIAPPMQIED
jgi:hypothetical protein